MFMTEDRVRAMLGMALFLRLMALFFGRVWSTRDAAGARLYPSQDLTALSASRGLKFVNGCANW